MHIEHPFPQRLRHARLAVKLSQRELGIKIGLDASSASSRMNHYEKGRHVPDYSLACKIANVLKVPVAYFYCDQETDALRLLKLAKLDQNGLTLIDEILERSTPKSS
ncbi:MAG: helix-turn-helix domain-containing protein [Idiomarina sp.]|nr:helix-turn-helix domain-containing protein [Idiomarina sp.]